MSKSENLSEITDFFKDPIRSSVVFAGLVLFVFGALLPLKFWTVTLQTFRPIIQFSISFKQTFTAMILSGVFRGDILSFFIILEHSTTCFCWFFNIFLCFKSQLGVKCLSFKRMGLRNNLSVLGPAMWVPLCLAGNRWRPCYSVCMPVYTHTQTHEYIWDGHGRPGSLGSWNITWVWRQNTHFQHRSPNSWKIWWGEAINLGKRGEDGRRNGCIKDQGDEWMTGTKMEERARQKWREAEDAASWA